jgi:hypothetical protein
MSKPGETQSPAPNIPAGPTSATPAVTKPNEPAPAEQNIIYSPEQKLPQGIVQYDKRNYDKYQAAANRDIAGLHGRANMAGSLMNLFNFKDPRLPEIYKVHYKDPNYDPSLLHECPCCSKFDSGKKVWLSIDNIALAPLGAAVPGFFDYIKFCITSLLCIGAIYSIYMMIIYGSGDQCVYGLSDSGCGDPWKFFLSAANYRPGGIDIIERTLMLISFLALYILKIVYFAWFRKLDAESNAFVTDITDYSVELRGLPKDITNQDIENFFHEQKKYLKSSKGKPVDPIVRNINYVFSNTDEIKKKTEAINKFITEFNKLVKEKKPLEAAQKKLEVEKEVKETEKLLNKNYTIPRQPDSKPDAKRPQLERFTGSAYVSFETVEQAELVRDSMMVESLAKIFYKLFRSLRGPFARLRGAKRYVFPYKSEYFYIEKAEKPAEIIFEHLGLSVLNRSIRKSFSFLSSVIVIAGTFALILYLKSQQNSSDTSQTGKLITVGIGILIKILGIVLSFITTMLIEFEKPETTTDRNIGTIWRSTISVFINSVLVLIVVNVIFKKDDLQKSMFTNVGVYNDLLFQLILAVIEAAVSFAEPSIPLNWLKAWWDRRKGTDSTIPQYEVNTYYEGAVFNFPRRFGKYLTLMMITFFLIRIFPYAPFIAALIAVVFYWSDKLFLLRLAKIPEYNTNELPLSMLRFMDMVFVTWTVGYILFDTIAYDTIYPWSWVMFSIALFSLVFNANYALRKTFVFDSEEENEKQTDLMTFIKVLKGVTYNISNPVDLLRITIKIWKKAEEARLKEQKKQEKLEKEQKKKEEEEQRKREKQALEKKKEELKQKQEAERLRMIEEAKQKFAENPADGTKAQSLDVAQIKVAEQDAEKKKRYEEEMKAIEEEEARIMQQEKEREEQDEKERAQNESVYEEEENDESEDVFLEQAKAQGAVQAHESDESDSERKSALNESEMFGVPMGALKEDDEDKYTPPEALEVKLKNLDVKIDPSVASEKKVEVETKGLKAEA